MEDLQIELPDGAPDNASAASEATTLHRRRPKPPARALRIAEGPRKPASDPPRPEVAAAASTVWFDYTDLAHYFEDNRLPTGIQRVQIGIFRASLARESGAGPGRVGTCSFDPVRRCWVVVPEALLAAVCRAACNAGGGDDDSWRALTSALRQSIATGQAAPFAPGDVLVNIGTSWWIPDYLRYVEHMQRERGLLYAPFVHDCIPLCVPETCSAGLVDEFGEWFAEAMRVADLVFANSAHTARDILRLAPPGPRGATVEPRVVRLDARFDDGPQPGSVATTRLDAITQARLGIRRPFALFVATVEVRKNHLFVFRCWQALVRRFGDAVPDLICVGKQGWLIEYTLNWLRVHPGLAHRVRLVGTLSDLDLAALYRTALFTVYCSHYEGWGLPVTESLCHGRVPLVVNHSSLPEAGGPFALYYTPEAQDEFCAGVERLLDPIERATLEAAIRAHYRPRGWSDVLAQIVDAARLAAPRARGGMAPPVVRRGVVYGFSGRAATEAGDGEARLAPGHALRHGLGWWGAEDWGCWSRQEQAHLLLRLPPRAPVDLLYLVLRGGPSDQVVRVQAGAEMAATLVLAAGQRRLVRLGLDPGLRGRDVLATLHARPYSLAPHTGGGDTREIGVGLEALAVVDRRDAAARLDLLEFVQNR